MGEPTKASGLAARLLTQADVAELFGVKPVTVRLWVRQGRIPKPMGLGKRPLWTAETINRFLDGKGAASVAALAEGSGGAA